VLSTLGALVRFAREGRLHAPLSGLLVTGTLPGVVVGTIVRVEWLANSQDFAFIASGVLLPLGFWVVLGSQRIPRERRGRTRRLLMAIWVLALVIGVVGGIYGIGGGSLLAPILIALGFSVYEVAPGDPRRDVPYLDRRYQHLPSPPAQPRRSHLTRVGPRSVPGTRRLRWELLRRAAAKPTA
jgi:hypothetical protein